MIPCANPSAAVQKHRVEIDAAVRKVLDQGRYILGPEVTAFESEFAKPPKPSASRAALTAFV